MKKTCKRHKRGKRALFRPGWYCARCGAFMEGRHVSVLRLK